MTSTRLWALFTVTCCLLIGQAEAYERTQELMSLVGVFNGLYTDSDQLKKEHDDHSNMTVIFRPVSVDAITEGPVMYVEERVNGKVFRQQFQTFVQDKDGLFHAIVRNISVDKIKDLNLDDLSNITPEDLHTDSDCSWIYMKASTGVYSVDKRDCRHGNNAFQEYSGYRALMTCTFCRLIVPSVGEEHFSSEAYELVRKGKRFPYPYPLDKFDLPCHDE